MKTTYTCVVCMATPVRLDPDDRSIPVCPRCDKILRKEWKKMENQRHHPREGNRTASSIMPRN